MRRELTNVSSSNKRERELARAKFERQQQRRAEEKAARRRRNQILAVVAGLAVVALAVITVVVTSRSGDDAPVAQPTPTPSTSASTSGSASPSPSTSTDCAKAPTPTTKTQTWSAPPDSPLKPDSQYFIKLDTNCGAIDIQIDPKAPKTAQSMIFLANQGYYTDSDCFRLTTDGLFVLQCGSPTNNGQGGPGYTVPDENLPKAGTDNYPEGTVAMANAGPGTAGSQFFIVYKNTTLPPDYTIWGKVVSGLDVVQKVAAAGVQGGGADGKPAQPIVITKATTRETTQVG
ncbi:MAG: peptidylprolyl isomerase [Candidatus Nanopelagicales bacterium]